MRVIKMEPIDAQTRDVKHSSFELLPLELQYEITTELPYENLINLCKTSRHFRALCNDNEVWERKLRADFPGARRTTRDAKAQFELLLADRVERVAAQIPERIKRDTRIRELESKIPAKEVALRKLKSKLRNLDDIERTSGTAIAAQKVSGEIAGLYDDITEIRDQYEREKRTLSTFADTLRIRARKRVPFAVEYRYIPVRVNNFKKLDVRLSHLSTEKLVQAEVIESLISPYFGKRLRKGNLVGITAPKITPYPQFLVYIYEHRGRLYADVADHALPDRLYSILKPSVSENFSELYHVPIGELSIYI
jgi:hypothetical protein